MYIVNGLAESIGGALAKFSDIKRATSVGETSCMMMNNHHRRVMPARRARGIQPATFGALGHLQPLVLGMLGDMQKPNTTSAPADPSAGLLLHY